MRQDGPEWLVGRVDVGDFVAIPPVGVRVIQLLSDGLALNDAASRLRAETGQQIDVADFAACMVGLGFVASVDGHELDTPPARRSSLIWLKRRYVQWLLSPVLHVAVAATIAAGLGVLAARPDLWPSPRDALWSDRSSVVLVSGAAMSWMLMFLHELAHLSTARAVGVSGRLQLSTRLYFLVAQTELSGIWSAERRIRLTVYLAGMALDATIGAVAVLVLATVEPTGAAHRALSFLVVMVTFVLVPQLAVFMRTDLYFVVQDLTRCRNLSADGDAYAVHLVKRLIRRTSTDPSAGLPPQERRAVRVYTGLLVLGSAACLGITISITFALIENTVAELLVTRSWPSVLDAALVLVTLGSLKGLWLRAWWSRHGDRVKQALNIRTPEGLCCRARWRTAQRVD